MKNRILRDPDPQTDDKPAGEAPAKEASGGVKDDGTKEALIEAQKALAEMKERVESSQSYQQDVQTMLSGDTTDQQKVAAATRVFKNQGFSDEQIQQELVRIGLGDEEEEEYEEVADDPTNDRLQALEQQLKAEQDARAKESQQTIVSTLETEISQAIENSPVVKRLVTSYGDDKERIEAAREMVRKDLFEKSRTVLQKRNKTGEEFRLDWLKEAVNNVLPETEKYLKRVIPNFDQLGSVGGATAPTEESLFAAKGGKQTEFPKFDENRGQFSEAQLKDSLNDSLLMMAAEVGHEDTKL